MRNRIAEETTKAERHQFLAKISAAIIKDLVAGVSAPIGGSASVTNVVDILEDQLSSKLSQRKEEKVKVHKSACSRLLKMVHTDFDNMNMIFGRHLNVQQFISHALNAIVYALQFDLEQPIDLGAWQSLSQPLSRLCWLDDDKPVIFNFAVQNSYDFMWWLLVSKTDWPIWNRSPPHFIDDNDWPTLNLTKVRPEDMHDFLRGIPPNPSPAPLTGPAQLSECLHFAERSCIGWIHQYLTSRYFERQVHANVPRIEDIDDESKISHALVVATKKTVASSTVANRRWLALAVEECTPPPGSVDCLSFQPGDIITVLDSVGVGDKRVWATFQGVQGVSSFAIKDNLINLQCVHPDLIRKWKVRAKCDFEAFPSIKITKGDILDVTHGDHEDSTSTLECTTKDNRHCVSDRSGPVLTDTRSSTKPRSSTFRDSRCVLAVKVVSSFPGIRQTNTSQLGRRRMRLWLASQRSRKLA
jgi:hypothetical protein